MLKAHGSILSAQPLVFTFERYRELMEQRPVYGAFMSNLFVNFNFLFLGYGVSDWDFDFFVQTIATRFGSPIRDHILIRKFEPLKAAMLKGEAAFLRLRYGIRTLWTEDYDVTRVLERAQVTAGPELRRIIADASSPSMSARQAAHSYFRSLTPSGARLATRVLLANIEKQLDDLNSGTDVAEKARELSEMAYSFAYLKPDRDLIGAVKKKLFELAYTHWSIEVPAHVLLAMDRLASEADMIAVESLGRYLSTAPDFPDRAVNDPDNRLPVYAERLILEMRARMNADGKPLTARSPLCVAVSR